MSLVLCSRGQMARVNAVTNPEGQLLVDRNSHGIWKTAFQWTGIITLDPPDLFSGRQRVIAKDLTWAITPGTLVFAPRILDHLGVLLEPPLSGVISALTQQEPQQSLGAR